MQEHLHNKYNRYAAFFYLCETSNLFIVISQIFVINKFLHYQFFDYGLRVYMWYSMPPEERLMSNLNPMCEVFPRLAACDYVRYGPGGGQEKKNALCVLGLNMINDKIFLVVWYWYLILVLIGSCRLIFRIATLTIWKFRSHPSLGIFSGQLILYLGPGIVLSSGRSEDISRRMRMTTTSSTTSDIAP